jgi:hypothetical protein
VSAWAVLLDRNARNLSALTGDDRRADLDRRGPSVAIRFRHDRARHRPTVMRGAQGPAGRHAIDGYFFAYSNFGAAFSASFVAPCRTILSFSCLNLPTGTAI